MTDQSAPPYAFGRLAAVIAAAGLLLALPATAQSVRREVDGPRPTAQQLQQQQADEQQSRIEDLQAQLAAATAENESLQHQLLNSQREVARLQAMVGTLAQANQDIANGLQQDQAGGAAPPQQDSTKPPAPTPLQPDGGTSGGSASLSGGPLPQGQLGTLPASQTPDPGDLYSQAQDLLRNGQYAQAEVAFADLLEHFPNANIANDARFWYAFTLLARHNDQDAARNFIQFLHDAPNAPRAPEAQVRLGMAFAEMGQTQQACTFYTNLPQRYPRAPANIRALAQSEAARNHCR
jgi:tol-pal system protein YbgF